MTEKTELEAAAAQLIFKVRRMANDKIIDDMIKIIDLQIKEEKAGTYSNRWLLRGMSHGNLNHVKEFLSSFK